MAAIAASPEDRSRSWYTPGWMSPARPERLAAFTKARVDLTTPALSRLAATSEAPSPGATVTWVKPVPLPT